MMHLSIFSPRRGGMGWDYPRELENLEKLGSDSLPMSHKRVSKVPWRCLKIQTLLLLEFLAGISKVPALC